MPAVAAGILAVAWPALFFRIMHINLCGHFLILLALGLAFRRTQRRGGWMAPAGVMLAAVLTQPYLFQLCAAVLAAIPLQARLERRPAWRRDVILYAGAGSSRPAR